MHTRSLLSLRRGAALAAVAVVALAAVAGFALTRSDDASDRLAEQTAQTLDAHKDVALTLESVIDMETGLRGYLLTGKGRFLAPWRQGRRSFGRLSEDVLGDLHAHRGQFSRLQQLGRAYIHGYGAWLIRARRSRALPARRAAAATSEGKRRVDEMRALVSRLHAALEVEAAASAAKLDAERGRYRILGVGALGALLPVLLLSFLLLHRGVLRPLRRLEAAFGSLSSGDFAASLEGSAAPEFAAVSDAFGEIVVAGQTLTSDLEDARLEVLQRLARATEYRDDDTHEHTERVGAIAARLGEAMGLEENFIDRLRLAAPLHDVGKVGVPDSILLKPGRFTDDERRQMQRHTTFGAEMLSDSPSPVIQLAEQIALSHHERWDGNGYPQGLSGDAIPLPARIVAVADVLDALTHERPYKPAWSLPQALTEINISAGSQFDPAVVTALLSLSEEDLRTPLRSSDSAELSRSGTELRQTRFT